MEVVASGGSLGLKSHGLIRIAETQKWQLRESLNPEIYCITGKYEKCMLPSSSSVYHQLSPKTHGRGKISSYATQQRGFLLNSVSGYFQHREMFPQCHVTLQSRPALIRFYRHNKSSGNRINGGVMCCLHPSELHICDSNNSACA